MRPSRVPPFSGLPHRPVITLPSGFLVFESLRALPGLRHVVTTRAADSGPARFAGNLGFRADDAPERVLESRRRAAASISSDASRLVVPAQAHTAEVAVVTLDDAGRGAVDAGSALPHTDALVTCDAYLPLLVQSADCALLLLYDPERRALGVVHAGWRGALAGIAARSVAVLRDRFGCRPSSIRAGIGPAIGPCCYEVGPDLVARIEHEAPAGLTHLTRRDGRTVLDLPGLIVDQLSAAGVPQDRIETARLCTRCRADLFFSYRREGPGTGRFGLLASLVPGSGPIPAPYGSIAVPSPSR
jgi:YfiH family protein